MSTKLKHLAQRVGLLGAISGVAIGASLTAAMPASAATSMRITTVSCVEETDEIGDDSPYFLVFAASTTNPNATVFGKWGPGSWDNEVFSGYTYHPNATIVSGASSGWIMISLMLEEDDGNDLTASEINSIGNNMYNQYQISFWKSAATRNSELRSTLVNTTDMYLTNDDMVASSANTASSSTTVHYVGDGGIYNVTYSVS